MAYGTSIIAHDLFRIEPSHIHTKLTLHPKLNHYRRIQQIFSPLHSNNTWLSNHCAQLSWGPRQEAKDQSTLALQTLQPMTIITWSDEDDWQMRCTVTPFLHLHLLVDAAEWTGWIGSLLPSLQYILTMYIFHIYTLKKYYVSQG
jgi:hypothetical protein